MGYYLIVPDVTAFTVKYYYQRLYYKPSVYIEIQNIAWILGKTSKQMAGNYDCSGEFDTCVKAHDTRQASSSHGYLC